MVIIDVSNSSSIEKAVNVTIDWTRQTSKKLGHVIAAARASIPAKSIDKQAEGLVTGDIDLVITVHVRGRNGLRRRCLPHLIKMGKEDQSGERIVVVLLGYSTV